jgi:hypothetical protein
MGLFVSVKYSCKEDWKKGLHLFDMECFPSYTSFQEVDNNSEVKPEIAPKFKRVASEGREAF